MHFEILPAIDLMDGACVRLQQGDANRKTRYSKSPEEVAREYELAGARRIHVVDLDGAFSGVSRNLETIKGIRKATSCKIEVGGGIRDNSALEALFEAGVDYVIIGTKALEDPVFLAEAIRKHGSRIIVGADARNGLLSTRGWTSDSNIPVVPYLRKIREEMGLDTVIFTDIARDGMFTSPNYDALEQVLDIDGLNIIASGGVGSLDDVKALRDMKRPNLTGVIVGKAIYDGRLDLQVAVAALSEHIGS